MRCTLLLALLAVSGHARADDRDHKTEVAQMAFLAQLAPKVCTDFVTNVEAVAAFMAGAGLNERELLEGYGTATQPVAEAFQASVERDADAACSQVWDRLGDEGLGLLTAISGE